MPNVSAPYNFVPLNEKVFFPPWANLVNHDVPFKDGLSGQIALEITAESPIFIRKPYEVGDAVGSFYERDDHEISKEFCNIKDENNNKRYYIPGSSLRNMLRSVVEIMSFSKLNFINKTEKFGFRDMDNPNLYTLRKDANDLFFGWLYKDASGIKIKESGNLGKLRDILNANTIPHTDSIFTGLVNFNSISISEKYNLYNATHADSATNFVASTIDPIIVITGNITGKRHEFKFKNPHTIITFQTITPEQFADFEQAYKVDKKNNENWKFWKPKFDNNKYVPVFYRKEEDTIIDFGLTVLYKMLHKHSLEDIISKQQEEFNSQSFDLAESIFGTIENEKLKGRVSVSHAFSDNAQPSDTEYDLILGEPKNSFYPFYIEQDVQENSILNEYNGEYAKYKTLSDEKVKISGRKRYPVHHDFNPLEIIPPRDENDRENDNVKSYFFPLQKDAVFKTKLVYHNLLPVELGALLSAITFHNSTNCRHNIGLAKAYGFGRIEMKITNISKVDQKNYMGLFKSVMVNFEHNWLTSPQIKELLAMATLAENQDRNKLKYMPLGYFQDIKKRNYDNKNHYQNTPKALPLYSNFMNINPAIISQKDCNLSSSNLKNLDIETIFNKLKEERITALKSKKNEIIACIKKINNTKILKDGINDFINSCNDYAELIDKVNKYKYKIGITANELLPVSDFDIVIKQLNLVYANMNNKKKKLFFEPSKKNTVSSWIGEEKTKEWFNSKQ